MKHPEFGDPEYCVFCGKLIPVTDRQLMVPHRYCSSSCAKKQQTAIRRLRTTSLDLPVTSKADT